MFFFILGGFHKFKIAQLLVEHNSQFATAQLFLTHKRPVSITQNFGLCTTHWRSSSDIIDQIIANDNINISIIMSWRSSIGAMVVVFLEIHIHINEIADSKRIECTFKSTSA